MVKKNQGQKNDGISRFKKIKLRTMDSDKKSIQEQGGGAPKPYSPGNAGSSSGGQNPSQNFPPQDGTKQFPPTNESSGQNNQGGESFPPKSNLTPGGGNSSINEPPKEDGGNVKPIGPEMPAGKKNKSGKKLFISLLVIILVVGVLAAGYFFVYPMLTEDDSEVEEGSGTEEATSTETGEETTETEEVSGEENNFDVPLGPGDDEEESDSEEEDVTEAGEIQSDSHVSLFSTPADSTIKKVLEAVTVENVKAALEISSTEVPIFREIILTDNEDNLIQTEELLSVIAPNTFVSGVRGNIEADPTLFTYTDDSGTWFGLVLKAKSSAELSQLKSDVNSIEENISEVKNFFLTNPGNVANSWSDGSVESQPSRYITFESSGASLSYTWFDDMLLISSSYSGAQEAASKLDY